MHVVHSDGNMHSVWFRRSEFKTGGLCVLLFSICLCLIVFASFCCNNYLTMSIRRIQLGSYVRLRRKADQPHSSYGKVKSEAGRKLWNVLFFGSSETEEKKSSQLSFVALQELPQDVGRCFGEKPLSIAPVEPITEGPDEPEANAPITPLQCTTHDKENSCRRTITGSRSCLQNQEPKTPPRIDDQSTRDCDHEDGYDRTVLRRSIFGKSVKSKKKARSSPQVHQGDRRILFADLEDNSNEDSSDDDEDYIDNEEVEEEEVVDEIEEDELILTVERLCALDRAINGEDDEPDERDLSDADAQAKTRAYLHKKKRAEKEKKDFISSRKKE